MVLTNFAVRQAKATGKPYTLNDTEALSLAVSSSGGKCWHFRYYWMDERKRMSLGTYPRYPCVRRANLGTKPARSSSRASIRALIESRNARR